MFKNIIITSEILKKSNIAGYIGVAILLVLMYLNDRRYKNIYWKLSEKWKNSDSKLIFRLKGIMVVIAIFLPLIIFILMNDIEFL